MGAQESADHERRKLRSISWVVLAFNVFVVVWTVGSLNRSPAALCRGATATPSNVFTGQASAADLCTKMRDLEAASVGLALTMGVVGDLVLGATWLATRALEGN